MTSPDLREKWSAARVRAAHQAPYLATALLSLDPVMVTGTSGELRRFPTDPGWHVYVGIEELARQSVQEVAFWLVHQVTHLLRAHARRYPGGVLEPQREEQHTWNLATDAEINDDLPPDLPPEPATPARLGLPDGWTAEQYWHALRENQPYPPIAPGDCGSGCDGLPRAWDHDLPPQSPPPPPA
ncbi:hypothetical protein ACFQQB_19305 [Nonomuraea rubra]|uniref:DUF2201 family putative metallopeptidase n=1 Tax=Nonomuraea rubra TaxID=46180 RepID=UPI003624668F